MTNLLLSFMVLAVLYIWVPLEMFAESADDCVKRLMNSTHYSKEKVQKECGVSVTPPVPIHPGPITPCGRASICSPGVGHEALDDETRKFRVMPEKESMGPIKQLGSPQIEVGN